MVTQGTMSRGLMSVDEEPRRPDSSQFSGANSSKGTQTRQKLSSQRVIKESHDQPGTSPIFNSSREMSLGDTQPLPMSHFGLSSKTDSRGTGTYNSINNNQSRVVPASHHNKSLKSITREQKTTEKRESDNGVIRQLSFRSPIGQQSVMPPVSRMSQWPSPATGTGRSQCLEYSPSSSLPLGIAGNTNYNIPVKVSTVMSLILGGSQQAKLDHRPANLRFALSVRRA